MAEPKLALETALHALLGAAAGVTWDVFGRNAQGRWSWDYVLVEPAGETKIPEKLVVYEYDYQVTAISLSAADALAQAAAVAAALETKPAVAGYSTPWVERVQGVDYAETLEGGQRLWHIGGVYRFRLREQPS